MKPLLRVIYKPEGGSPREWTIDMANPPWDVTYAAEKATGWPWGVFRERIGQESAIARQALLWTLRKRDEPRLGLESVRPDMSEVGLAVPCPLGCGEWISTLDDDEHECSGDPGEEPEAQRLKAVEGSKTGEA